MITFIPYDTKTLLYPEKFFEEVERCRYKDTSYSIVKESRRSWEVYIIDEDGVYLTNGYYSKPDAVNEIESGRLAKEFETQFKNYNNVLNILKNKN